MTGGRGPFDSKKQTRDRCEHTMEGSPSKVKPVMVDGKIEKYQMTQKGLGQERGVLKSR